MKKVLISSILCFSFANTANAGFFDFLFGGGDKEEVQAEEVVTTKVEAKSAEVKDQKAELVDTALTLIPLLTSQLGVSEEQAEGGVGSLMGFAKSVLSSDEFSQLKAGVPNVGSLLAAAPTIEQSDSGKAISGMLSQLGGEANQIAGLDVLNKQFESLGLNPEMVAQFAQLIMSYFSDQGGDAAALLQKGLGSLLG